MITKNDIFADLHTHTIFSEHGYSTIQENIQVAKENNLKFIAITDHYYNKGTSIEKKNETTRIKYMEDNINPYLDGFEIIASAEFNVGQEIVVWDKLKTIRWKPIGLHSWFFDINGSTLDDLYKAFEQASKTHNCFTHIERELHKIDNEKYKDNLTKEITNFLKRICDLAKENNIFLEVNESSLINDECGGYKRLRYWLEYAKRNGNYISLGSDAHYCGRVGEFTKTIKLLNEIDFPKERILNCNMDLFEQRILQKSDIVTDLIHLVEEKYPMSIQHKGRFSEEEMERLEKYCDVRCPSVYMDGSAIYSIRYRK